MGSLVQYLNESDMKNSMKMLQKQTKKNMTLLQFQKEPFLLIPTIFQSQTQGQFCNVSNCQTHIGSDERALPIPHGLLKHFAQPFITSRLDLQSQNNQLSFDSLEKMFCLRFTKKGGIAFHIHGSNMWYGKTCIGICRCCLFHSRLCLF